jgi:hypothetical protein
VLIDLRSNIVWRVYLSDIAARVNGGVEQVTRTDVSSPDVEKYHQFSIIICVLLGRQLPVIQLYPLHSAGSMVNIPGINGNAENIFKGFSRVYWTVKFGTDDVFAVHEKIVKPLFFRIFIEK